MASAVRPRRLCVLAAVALAASVSACSGGYRLSPSSAQPTAPAAPATAAHRALDSYTVVAGDTIYVVARRFGMTVRSLIDANGLQPPFELRPGQVLRLPTGGGYVVVKGDTLSKVARKAGVEFATLARINGLNPPYVIHVGQRLMLPTGATVQPGAADVTVIESPALGQPGSPIAAPVAVPVAPMQVEELPAPPPGKPTQSTAALQSPPTIPAPGSSYKPFVERDSAAPETPPPANAPPAAMRDRETAPPAPIVAAGPSAPAAPAASSAAPPAPPRPQTVAVTAPPTPPAPPIELGISFIWPVHGPILDPFGTPAKGQHNDGINIAVPKGTPVLAAADGDVAYAGNELRGFGNLLLIKHTGTDYVTAYAHNEKLLVRRGDHVRRGQKIALSGDSGGVAEPQLHFELRQGVKPIDPQTMLPAELSPAAAPADRPGPG